MKYYFFMMLIISFSLHAEFSHITNKSIFTLDNLIQQEELQAQYYLGLEYYLAGQYENALKWIESAAQQGNRDAQITLGDFYQVGLSVTQSNEQALKWYTLAFNQYKTKCLENKIAKIQEVEDKYHLGMAYFFAGDYQKAIQLLEFAANANKVEAQYELETLYQYVLGKN